MAKLDHPERGDRVVCRRHALDLLDEFDEDDRPAGDSSETDHRKRGRGEARLAAPAAPTPAPSASPAGSGPSRADPEARAPEGDRPGARNSRCGAVAVALVEDTPASRPAQCPADPATSAVLSGTCILRRLSGSAEPQAGARDDEAAKSGDQQ